MTHLHYSKSIFIFTLFYGSCVLSQLQNIHEDKCNRLCVYSCSSRDCDVMVPPGLSCLWSLKNGSISVEISTSGYRRCTHWTVRSNESCPTKVALQRGVEVLAEFRFGLIRVIPYRISFLERCHSCCSQTLSQS